MNTMSTIRDCAPHTDEQSSFGIVKALLTVIIAVLIGVLSSPWMYTNDTPPAYRIPIFACMIAMIFVLSVGRIGKLSKQKLTMLFLWSGFASMALVSGLLTDEDILAVLWLSLGVPYLLFCVFPQAAGRHGNVMVLMAIVLGLAPYVAASLILYPLNGRYFGVFTNPNGFGVTVVTMSAALLGLLRGAISATNKNVIHWLWISILWIMVGAAFPFIVLSNSRTSLITYVVLMMIFVGSLFFNRHKNRWWITISAIIVLGAVAVFLVSGLSNDVYNSFFGRIIDKMETKAQSGDISGGRFKIWESVLSQVELFGKGSIGFPQKFGGLAHNTYIMVLGATGPLALGFLIAIHGFTVFIGFKMVTRNIRRDGYAVGPLLVILNYIVLGLAETVYGFLGNGINMSFLLMTGVLVHENWAEEVSLESAENRPMKPMPQIVEGEIR